MSEAGSELAALLARPQTLADPARVLARLPGCYLPRITDLGTAERKTLTDGENVELRRAREQYEELEHGFAEREVAVEAGGIDLHGMRSD